MKESDDADDVEELKLADGDEGNAERNKGSSVTRLGGVGEISS
jgi:hypothetical protein